MRPIYVVSGLVSVSMLLSETLHLTWLREGQRWFKAVWQNEAGLLSPAEVEKRVVTQVYCARKAEHEKSLVEDPGLKQWLGSQVGTHGVNDLDELVRQVQMAQPHYLKFSAYAAQSPSVDGLLEKVAEWKGQTDSELTHGAVVAWARPARMGFECVVVAGERLPGFKPESLREGNEHFYSVCSLCGQGHFCRIPIRNRSVSLECPSCHRIYAMIAIDLHGHFHYMNEYLTGWQPPAHFPAGISRYKEMCLIWQRTVKSINYVSDATPTDPDADTWQFAQETMQLGQGDCEDSAILLADWLIARGFEARVAVGRFGEVGGHAWVIVRLDGKSYLLEATNPNVTTSVPPFAQDVGSRYVPQVTMDPHAIYMRVNGDEPWDGDYWSKTKWRRVEPRASQVNVPDLAQAAPARAP